MKENETESENSLVDTAHTFTLALFPSAKKKPRTNIASADLIRSGFKMTTFQTNFDVQPDTEGILSITHKLKERGGTESLLLSNLDFAVKMMRLSPISKISTLLVKGDGQYVRIGKDDSITYTITSEGGNRRVDCLVYVDSDYNLVNHSHITGVHFSMHSCQDERQSCFKQAKDALINGRHPALRIECNRFSVTYTIRSVPWDIMTIQTRCHFSLSPLDVEGLLKRKCWLQKEKAPCPELIACMDHLIEKYLTASHPPTKDVRFLLQGDGEVVSIISSDISENYEQYILGLVLGLRSAQKPTGVHGLKFVPWPRCFI
ncbi:uncharacterized protein LOC143485995 [Brachyhypopomus gauderio]|uniref:uncharacterized protein LOC143485995 n=1 Tax=Brachyhypopomus gauderio TaxID=698409 RepID=UPI0040439306